MKNFGILFSGQGCQKNGMGSFLYKNFDIAKKIFDESSEILNFDIKKICFDEHNLKLSKTNFCQVALYIHDYILLRILRKNCKNFKKYFSCSAGLSLGEITAIVSAGALEYQKGLLIVKKRGELMQEACEKMEGSMAALIGTPNKKFIIKEFCKKWKIEISNFNSPDQIIISGKTKNIKNVLKEFKKYGFKMSFQLPVSGAFHSSLMKVVGKKFNKYLLNFTFKKFKVPVISNLNGLPIKDGNENIRNVLVQQISSPVHWINCIKYLSEVLRINYFYECGPKKVLSNFVSKINPSLKTFFFDENKKTWI
jgi:[acyl-carrier-protein] S-malonyltransferase